MTYQDFLTKNKTDLDGLIAMSTAAANRVDYIQGGGGNTSVKLQDGIMAIKASGFSMGQISYDNAYALLNLTVLQDFFLKTNPATLSDIEQAGSAKTKEAVVKVEGLKELRPSVEAGFHSILKKYVLHTHSVYANILACSDEIDSLTEKIFADADYTVVVVPYVDPGPTLTFCIQNIMEQEEKKTNKCPSIIIMQNHGIVAHGDTSQQTTALHEDANLRLAKFFGLTFADFPTIQLRQEGEHFLTNTPWLKERLATGKYGASTFLETTMYPDQMVFLTGNVAFVNDSSALMSQDSKCTVDTSSGNICYKTNQAEALVIEQTLCCVLFIQQTIAANGYHVHVMDSASKNFIAGWESEAYRKSLLKDEK